jgi:hypothetical protein
MYTNGQDGDGPGDGMSKWTLPPGAAGPLTDCTVKLSWPTLDSLVPNLPTAFRAALLPMYLSSRVLNSPTDWLACAADPQRLPPFDPVPLADNIAAAALGCPDLFLIATPSGSSRDRCLRTLVSEAVNRGERVLVLAPNSTAADHLTDWLHDVDRPAVRALTDHEDSTTVPVRTSVEHGRSLIAAAQQTLTAAVRSAEEQLARLAADTSARLARIDASAQIIDAERAARQAELVALREQLKQIALLAEAREAGSLLNKLYWRARFTRNVEVRKSELEQQIQAAEAAIQDCDTRAEQCNTERAAAMALDQEARKPVVETLALARRFLDGLADEAAAARRFLARVPIVVAPPGAVDDPAVCAARFDRLIVAAAECLSESDVRSAARLADRGVLFGSRLPGCPSADCCDSDADWFRRLWDRLHRPVWIVEDGRLVCRLAESYQRPLDCEPCADRPEIELRFGTTADGTAVVAEIAFPDISPQGAADAKTFLARELGEVRLNPWGPARWFESDDRLVVEWSTNNGSADAVIGPGVIEELSVVDGLPQTTRVIFERSAGWDRISAQRWVEQHTAAVRVARTAYLPARISAAEPAEACLV